MKKLFSHFIVAFHCVNFISQDVKYEVVVPNLSIPWGFTFLPDNNILYTEKEGDLYLFKDGISVKIKGMPEVTLRGQGGLMDVELHPDFEENNWIYFTYASSEGEGSGANTVLMRTKLVDDRLTKKEKLYKAEPNSRRGQHFGSRIAFDKNNHVYFSVGDRGNRNENPQDLTRDCGKIYRLNDDGSIPEDNPFVNVKNAKKAIYSYGHRNPQGMERNPFTGEIWTHEHGPKGGDEINIIQKGKNYGWPIISYGVNYSGTKFTNITKKEGMEQPLLHWTPSIAPSGMAFVSSDVYSNWKGNLLVGSLKFQYIANCYLKDGKVIKQEKLLEGIGRVRSIELGNDGYIYAGVEGLGIIKILPN